MSWWPRRWGAHRVRREDDPAQISDAERLRKRQARIEPLEPRMLLAGSAPTDLVVTPNYVDEDQAAGTVVGRFRATDADAGNTFTYGLVTGSGGADNRFFAIQSDQLVTKSVIDFEARQQNTYSVLVRVTDNTGLWLDKALSITLNDVNEAPAVLAHDYAATQNKQLVVAAPGLLKGASDPEHDPFTASVVADKGPTHGTVSLNPDGSFVYQADQDYVGSDEFQYRAFDGQLYSDPATVTIAVDYGPDAVVQAPTLVVGPNNLVLARVEDNILLVSFADRQVLLNRPASAIKSITVVGADYRADTLSIDSSVTGRGVLAGGVTFRGGSGGGADTLVLRGSAGADKFTVAAASAKVNSLRVAFANVERLVLDGKGGNDTYRISALPVSTTISDGTGVDTLDFSAASSGVNIDLGSRSAQKLFRTGGRLTLNGTIENVIGTGSADWIKGNSADNRIEGRGGNDVLLGEAGNDVLSGGSGNDRLDGGSGRNLLIDEAGSSALRGKVVKAMLVTARDRLFGRPGRDWLFDPPARG